MKKFLALSLALVMILALAACGNATTNQSSAPESTAPESSAPESAAPESSEPAAEWVKNVEIQVPASAGGGTDVVARALVNYINQNCDSNLTVVNNTDGSGVVAFEKVRNAKADGSTLLHYHTSMLIKVASGVYDKSILDNFTVIAVGQPVEKGGYVLVVPADSGIDTLDDFIALAKSEPGELLFGVETGGSSHVMAGLMSKAAGIDIKYVEAGPDTEKMTALVGGSIDACLVNPNQAKQYVEAGKVKALAIVSTDKEGSRGSVLPDVPSFIEQGVNFSYVINHFILGPKDMDPELAKYINSLYVAAADDPAVKEILVPAGFDLEFLPFDEGAEVLNEQQEELSAVIDELGLKK
ncbi:MAG: tripartite tricarboxylate transporter substrate-binding protein [Oscillospiraceae bacterium]